MTVDYGNPDRIEQITNAGNHTQTIIGPQGVVGAGSKPALNKILNAWIVPDAVEVGATKRSDLPATNASIKRVRLVRKSSRIVSNVEV